MGRIAPVVLLSLLALPVMAQQQGPSWGVMVGSSSYSQTGYSFDMPTITGRLAHDLTPWLAAEGRLAYGASDTNNNVGMGINWLAGAYLKASIETIERLHVTAYGGYTSIDTAAEVSGRTTSVNKGGVSGGLGLDFYASTRNGINIEWMRYFDDTLRSANTTIDHVGIGYFQKF